MLLNIHVIHVHLTLCDRWFGERTESRRRRRARVGAHTYQASTMHDSSIGVEGHTYDRICSCISRFGSLRSSRNVPSFNSSFTFKSGNSEWSLNCSLTISGWSTGSICGITSLTFSPVKILLPMRMTCRDVSKIVENLPQLSKMQSSGLSKGIHNKEQYNSTFIEPRQTYHGIIAHMWRHVECAHNVPQKGYERVHIFTFRYFFRRRDSFVLVMRTGTSLSTTTSPFFTLWAIFNVGSMTFSTALDLANNFFLFAADIAETSVLSPFCLSIRRT